MLMETPLFGKALTTLVTTQWFSPLCIRKCRLRFPQLSEACNTLITSKRLFPTVYKQMLMETPLLGKALTTLYTSKCVPHCVSANADWDSSTEWSMEYTDHIHMKGYFPLCWFRLLESLENLAHWWQQQGFLLMFDEWLQEWTLLCHQQILQYHHSTICSTDMCR